MSDAWTENDTEKLIAFYAQHECLWNPFHPEFKNKLSRYEAYEEIKKCMNIPELTICDCIRRIANAKKEYCYELSKITAAIFCEKLYTSKVKWFKRMHMLFFPYTQASHYTSYFRKQDNNKQKFNNNNQDNSLHIPFKKSEDKQICSNDICGTCETPEIELRLKLRGSVHSALQDAVVPSETIQTINVAAGASSSIVAEYKTQPDIHEGRGITCIDKGKKVYMLTRERTEVSLSDFDELVICCSLGQNKGQDCSTCIHDIPVEPHGRRRTEDRFDIFGKSVAFQLRTIDTQTAIQLEKEIQNLITKARLRILETKLTNQSSMSSCCSDCNNHNIMCEDETCDCGLTLKECLLLTSIKESKGYSYKQ